MNIVCLVPPVPQAWAASAGICLTLGKFPLMNMENFDPEVWHLHRKLFHRYIKYERYFTTATAELAEFQQAKLRLQKEREKKIEPEPSASVGTEHHDICLLSSSSEELSEDEDEVE